MKSCKRLRTSSLRSLSSADSPSRWRPQNLAGGDVEAGAVKGTGHHRAVHLPLGEGASTVRAGVVDGVQRAGHVEERHRLSFDVDGDRRPGRDVLRLGNLDESSHLASLPWKPSYAA